MYLRIFKLIHLSLFLFSACTPKTKLPLELPKKVVIKKVISEEKKLIRELTLLDKAQTAKSLDKYCKETDFAFRRYGWGKSSCSTNAWLIYKAYSKRGRPLIFKTFGKVLAPINRPKNFNTTLIMCGVHGDEITPVKFCDDVLRFLTDIEANKVIDIHTKKIKGLENRLVILAPVVSPDSFFKRRPTRTNANGVDINRNFPTEDFKKESYKAWKNRYRSDKRRFPGKKAMSEIETAFQVDLIERFKPDKIVSVHAPLKMLDYDGPADQHTGGLVGSRANQLLIKMSENADGYRIKNYPFFPGSLGNWAGNERNIPTFTLELPTSDNRDHKKHWKLFKASIHSAVMHSLEHDVDVASGE